MSTVLETVKKVYAEARADVAQRAPRSLGDGRVLKVRRNRTRVLVQFVHRPSTILSTEQAGGDISSDVG